MFACLILEKDLMTLTSFKECRQWHKQTNRQPDLQNVTIHTIRDDVKLSGMGKSFNGRKFNLLSQFQIFLGGKRSKKRRECYF